MRSNSISIRRNLAALEQRVSLFETLKRKYGGSIPEVIAFGERAAERMRKIEGRDAELDRLAKEIASTREEMLRDGQALRKLRAKNAPKLSEEIRRQSARSRFPAIGVRGEAHAAGRASDQPDSMPSNCLFSPNPGEPLKPLRAIASSGEISRLMLAIKSALAAHDAIPLLVFDEIDANVGGEIANAVGEKMRTLARNHQILCITHLPQVAAAASSHFIVTKEVAGGRTIHAVARSAWQSRREEIARMLGGQTESALRHAAVLLKEKS